MSQKRYRDNGVNLPLRKKSALSFLKPYRQHISQMFSSLFDAATQIATVFAGSFATDALIGKPQTHSDTMMAGVVNLGVTSSLLSSKNLFFSVCSNLADRYIEGKISEEEQEAQDSSTETQKQQVPETFTSLVQQTFQCDQKTETETGTFLRLKREEVIQLRKLFQEVVCDQPELLRSIEVVCPIEVARVCCWVKKFYGQTNLPGVYYRQSQKTLQESEKGLMSGFETRKDPSSSFFDLAHFKAFSTDNLTLDFFPVWQKGSDFVFISKKTSSQFDHPILMVRFSSTDVFLSFQDNFSKLDDAVLSEIREYINQKNTGAQKKKKHIYYFYDWIKYVDSLPSDTKKQSSQDDEQEAYEEEEEEEYDDSRSYSVYGGSVPSEAKLKPFILNKVPKYWGFDCLVFKAQDQVKNMVKRFKDAEVSTNPHACAYLSFLLYGPPGTGKSSFAPALAHELERHIAVINFPNAVLSIDKFRLIFQTAVQSNMILFLDEFDLGIKQIRSAGRASHQENCRKRIEFLKEQIHHLRHLSPPVPTPAPPSSSLKEGPAQVVVVEEPKELKKLKEDLNEAIQMMNQSPLDEATLQTILCGEGDKSGRVLLATTNHLEDIPAPMKRPGRFTPLSLDLLEGDFIKQLIAKFFQFDSNPSEDADWFKEQNFDDVGQWSPASLKELYHSFNDVKLLVSELRKQSQDIKQTPF